MPERAPLSPLLWALVIGLGVALRIYAFAQNTRLQGDVNLLALTAREYAESGDLYYPLKYTSPPYVPYAALREPATQHPLLVPWLAGIACRLWGTDDAFAILKLLSAAGCILHWLLAAALAWRYCGAYAWLPIFLTAFSPLVVDYSANGSPYITAAALMLFPFLWLLRRRSPGAAVCAALGLLCGVGFQIHGFFLAILAGCLWAVSRAKPARAILRAFLLLAVFLFSLVPTVIWSWRHTGMWLCASTLQHPAG
ncbi:MAG: hypothetical protein N3A66_12075, partial [Planctomycetota bacterium]|nr:hypothetical protein [Planctomycetota bacterium]